MNAFFRLSAGLFQLKMMVVELISRVGECAEDYTRRKAASNNLPRERLLQIFIDKDLCRPAIN